MRTASCLLVSCLALALPLFAQDSKPTSRRSQPNIVLFFSDDAGYADFGFQGSKQIQTPNIDAIASSGVRFTSGYVSASICSPSRAGMLTGRYQQRFGHVLNLPFYYDHRFGLDLKQVTIADRLKKQGYRTGIIGKWHLGERPQFHPNKRGFDFFFGVLKGSRSYRPYREGQRAAKPDRLLMRNGERAREGGYFTDRIADEAAQFVERNTKRPFFLYVSFTAVHTPMHAKPGDLRQLQDIKPPRRRKLVAMTRAMDRGIGKVMAALKKHGLSQNTLVWFLNDNGGAKNNASRNQPLRGKKGCLLEGGIRVPFAVSWPGVLPAGKTFDLPVISLDILPTPLAAAGGKLTPADKIDGVNLLGFLKEGKEVGEQKPRPPHDALFWSAHDYRAVRSGNFKLLTLDVEGATHRVLFNLAEDLGETRNIASKHLDKVKELAALLEAWRRDNQPPAFRAQKEKPDAKKVAWLRGLGLLDD